jgi:hypothetical protein
MKRIIFKESGLDNLSLPPNGYRYVGYDDVIISEKFGATISPIGGSGSQDLESVLSEGNTTGGNNIVLSDGDVINSASGGGQLDLRYGADNKVMLSTDAGAYSKEYLNMESGYIELSAVDGPDGLIAMFADEYNTGFSLGPRMGTDFQLYGVNGGITNNTSTFEGDGDLRLSHSNYVVIDSKLYVYDDLLLLNTNAIKGVQGQVNIGDITTNLFGLGASLNDAINIGFNNKIGITSGSRENVILIGSNIDEDVLSDKVYIKDLVLPGLPTHADNAAAISGGLIINQVYKTSTGELRIVV